MSLFLEKSMLASRFLSCLIAISVFVLVVSSLSLLQFADNSFIPRSVFRLILVNTTSLYSTSSVTSGESKTPFLTPETSSEQSLKSQEVACQTSSSSNSSAGVGVNKACDAKQALLRVYMHDLPPEFHFGLLGWKGSGNEMWPNVGIQGQVPSYPGGLNLQHSIEYWLTLDLLSSNIPNITRPCTAIRVQNSSEADVIFVAFFSSLSYNRHSKPHGKEKVSLNRILQDRVVEYLRSRDEWKLKGGADHLIVAHHPNSMLVARKKLGSAMFVLADFGRYRAETANIEKDVIAPYKHMVRTLDAENSPSFRQRDILVYFQGAIYRKDGGTIRQELYYLLKDEKDVHFTFGSIRSNGVREAGRGMASSKFCLNIAGDTPSSNRLFDAIASHCVPVIISDDIELPFEDVIDYSKFCIFVRSSDAVKKGYLLNFLRGIKEDQWTKMWKRLKELTKHFEYQHPSQPNDAVDMIWQAISRKLSFIQLKAHRNNRYHSSQLFLKDR
ncbi:probable arabinosyltransferase ARAD2 [Nicotiana tomentosiformis]|uniref:probable arabinosyltransferase ARAD2 n=1 Tax=Nicotiana tomentosiformis TaxID=4098 RepID=UPI00051AD21B|nr:probable arabinosyltransferase ARAD2 [Nicotiana tomentosiformis]XP_009609030.1 probable arabinosyltransferase ARAD2 [Nicotiana tomentosiformis]XP_009609031.1 probable arabinosyltransferase ARAD2 [Nicotiana tomentosiformis]XP_033513769.1 probable arabinosyltransferase ARAD2 [Nicotiana tomentosiformis]XP_033513770.1 probable arabinosyltransferase ARAD2 [Nicotiana tomentosiformis]